MLSPKVVATAPAPAYQRVAMHSPRFPKGGVLRKVFARRRPEGETQELYQMGKRIPARKTEQAGQLSTEPTSLNIVDYFPVWVPSRPGARSFLPNPAWISLAS